MSPPIVIIGSGLAGWTTAREFRKLDAVTPVHLITADSGDFYAKPSLSNAFAQKRAPTQLISTAAAKMAESLNVTLSAHSRVESIRPEARNVTFRPAAEGEPVTLHYRQLVLATGAQPIRIPIKGLAAQQVVSINNLDDFARFHAHLTATDAQGAPVDAADQHVLIMGAGLIGCEFANDLAHAGFKVSVVDPGPRALAALLPEDASQALEQALTALGVRFYFGTTLVSVDPTDANPGSAALAATLSSGELLRVSSVLSAVGLRPDTALALEAGLKVDRGVLVDTRLQTSREGIYALGDGAQYASMASELSPHGAILPYVMPIMAAARVLAANLAGTTTDLTFSLMPVSIKTPALPLVVASPRQGCAGAWANAETGIWQWLDAQGSQRGFVLAGPQTAQRSAQSKLVLL
ncbi:MAG: FAD-dependent oxidoreductase [Pseudomonadota bacterium]